MQDWLASILKMIAEYKVLIAATLLSITMSSFKSIKKYRRLDWIEASICGCLTLAIYSALKYMGLPQEIGIFLGGVIGFKGSLWVDGFIDKKSGNESGGSK